MLLNSLLNSLVTNHNFFGEVFPFLKAEYFTKKTDRLIVEAILKYHLKYNKAPSFANIRLQLDTDYDICQEDTTELFKRLKEIEKFKDLPDLKALIDQTEQYFKDRALEKAINESIEIIDKNGNRGEIETKIKDALSIAFVTRLGHDYWNDVHERMLWYEKEDQKIPLNVHKMNEAIGGGLVRKAMFCFMANTNVGKSIIGSHCASSLVMEGHNVLLCSGEMSEQEMLKRHDANILDISIDTLGPSLDKALFKSRFKTACDKPHGILIVKEFPTGTANANHIKKLIHEAWTKKKIKFDVVVLDGLNNFASYKIPASLTGTSLYVKSVAEENRALCMEEDFALLTFAQFNRGAKGKQDKADLEDVGEAYAISQTVDFAGSMLQTDELREQGKYLIKNLKTRFGKNKGVIYTIGIDYDKMRLTNLAEKDQEIPMHIRDQLAYQKQLEELKEESNFLEDADYSGT
jgi:archaellum biogenesis ATPase FlaH